MIGQVHFGDGNEKNCCGIDLVSLMALCHHLFIIIKQIATDSQHSGFHFGTLKSNSQVTNG